MNSKIDKSDKNTTRPNLERFKYEVAQEMGLSTRNKTISKDNVTTEKVKGFKNGKTF